MTIPYTQTEMGSVWLEDVNVQNLRTRVQIIYFLIL